MRTIIYFLVVGFTFSLFCSSGGATVHLKVDSLGSINQQKPETEVVNIGISDLIPLQGISFKPSTYSDHIIEVSGTQSDRWNYVATRSLDPSIEPGAKYRLEAQIKVVDISDPKYPPYLKLGVSDNQGNFLKNYNTSKYDLTKKGTWQAIWGEFTVDPSAGKSRIAIEKGTQTELSVVLSVKNLRLTKIRQFSPLPRYELDLTLNSLSNNGTNVHPRLYLANDKITSLKSKLSQYPYSKFWKKVQSSADFYVSETPPVDMGNYDDNSIRKFGNYLPFIGMAYLISNDEKYLIGAKKWMDALSSYPDWASNNALGAAHLIFGMSVVYDWLYDKFSIDEKKQYETKIAKHADILYECLIQKSKGWADTSLGNNHNYINVMAIAVAGMALYGHDSRAESWLAAAQKNFDDVLPLLSPDGVSPEGIGYWGYGTEALLKYFMAVKPLGGIENIKNNLFFQNTATFRLYASLPGYKDNVDFADSPRFDWYGPGYLLRALADIFEDGNAQWLAEEIEQARGKKAKISWLDLLWYNPDIKPISPILLPKTKLFENMGIIITRSGWDDDDFWVFFKAGPPQGHLAKAKQIYQGGHIHPDAGNFLIWADKKWVLLDDGYVYKKRTENHNVITINGIGQLGDGKTWLDAKEIRKHRGSSQIIYLKITDHYQYVVSSLGNMYRPESGLTNWYRTFVSFPNREMVVIKDSFEMKEKSTIRTFFHFNEALQFDAQNNDFYFSSDSDNLTIALQNVANGLSWKQYARLIDQDEQRYSAYGNYMTNLISFEKEIEKDTNIFVISKHKSKAAANTISLYWNKNAQILNIASSEYQYVVNFDKQEVH